MPGGTVLCPGMDMAPKAGGDRPDPAQGGVPTVEPEREGQGTPGGLRRSGLHPSTWAGGPRCLQEALFPCEFGWGDQPPVGGE